MTFKVISTGSQGNAVVIENSVLIDCGVPFKSLKDVYRGLKIVLLTHIHTDHFNKATIKKLAQERPMLRFGCCEWLVDSLLQCGVEKKNIDVLDIGKAYEYGLFKVLPILLYHNVQNCGYKIIFGDQKMLYATDTNTLDAIEASNYDLYMLEANYTDDEMAERLRTKDETGQYAYEHEVMKNHLSKEKCDEFIYKNAGQNSEYVYLHRHIDRGEHHEM